MVLTMIWTLKIPPRRLNSFFKEYGTIDWIPNVQANADGTFKFPIPDTFRGEIQLFVEGIINGNTFVSESKTINTASVQGN